jgi:hypothetical protein
MRDSEDIQELIEQLKILQLQQTDILDRLDSARSRQGTDNASQGARATAETTSRQERQERENASRVTTRELIVGDFVLVRNPGLFQADRGEITKITASRVTIKTTTGSKIIRSPRNVVLIQHE